MHDRTGTPSSCTVQAPQCPSLHAIFVPVRPIASRSVSASDRPTWVSTRCGSPLTTSSSTGRHRQDVGELDHAKCRPGDLPALLLVLDLGQRPPDVTCRLE